MSRFVLRSVLVATDFTAASDGVLRSAAALAAHSHADLHVLHAFDFQDSPYAEESRVRVTFQGRIADAERALEEQIQRTVPPELAVASREIVIVSAHRAILERAAAVAADLIVLGPHRGTRILDRFLGSTADRVIRSSEVPCLIVRAPLLLPLRQITVPLDLSKPARGALDAALTWADTFGAADSETGLLTLELGVVHVIPRVFDMDDLPFDHLAIGPELHREVEEALVRSGRPEVAVREEVVWGDDAAEEIVRDAERRKADLLVMATHGYGALRRALIGSVTSAVARSASCNLLLVPPTLWYGGRDGWDG